MRWMRRHGQRSISVVCLLSALTLEIVDQSDKGLLGPGACASIKISEGQVVSLIFRMPHLCQTLIVRRSFYTKERDSIYPYPGRHARRDPRLNIPLLVELHQVVSSI